MSVKYIPPSDKRTVAIHRARSTIVSALEPFIKGRRGKEKDGNLASATDAVMQIIIPILKLPSTPDKGATIMTEGASMRNPHTGDFGKKPENL